MCVENYCTLMINWNATIKCDSDYPKDNKCTFKVIDIILYTYVDYIVDLKILPQTGNVLLAFD